MPKKLNITANNLKLRHGWLPPIPDTEGSSNLYHGGAEFFKDRKNYDTFHKILKENLGFNFEADPEDVENRIIITSKLGRAEFGKYRAKMKEISRMPDSQEKIEQIRDTAWEYERALYHQMAKGRLVFIPLGETEPRQLRYNPTSGEFQISYPFAGMKEHQEMSEQLLPKVNGKVVTQKQEQAPQIVDPGEFEEKMISKPQPPSPFRMQLRRMPEPDVIPPLRDMPDKPADIVDVNKTKYALIEEEYDRILKASDLEEPTLKVTENAPVFRLNKPNPVKKPVPIKDGLKEPVKPAIEAEIEKVEAELRGLKAPEFPYESYVRTQVPKPDEVEKPFEPVLENPDPPEPPEYAELPNEPVFKHPTLPTYKVITPNWNPGDPPKVPAYPELPALPEKPVLRDRPIEPVKPSWFRRIFNWSLIDEYNARHTSWEEDDHRWQAEREAMPQRLLDYEVQLNSAKARSNELLLQYQADVKEYVRQFDEYNVKLAEYAKQVEELDAENNANYDQYVMEYEAYENARKELGPKYDEDYRDFLKEHEDWEKQTQSLRAQNEALENEYKNSDLYKDYEVKQIWYDKNVKPYAFMIKDNVIGQVKENLKKEYDENLVKYENYLKEKGKYDEEAKWVDRFHKEKDLEINGNNPDYEENMDVRLSQKRIENAEVNARYDAQLKDYNLKKDVLQKRYNELAADPEHVRYAKEKAEYDENERLKKTVIVKKPYEDSEKYQLNYDANYDELNGAEKSELNAKLDNALKEENQLLPSEYNKMLADEMKQAEGNKNINGDDDSEYDEELSADGNDALNYTFVEDPFLEVEEEPKADKEIQREPKEGEIKLTQYEYELQKFNEYEKDLKYYNLMEKRYQEKLDDWKKQSEANEEWNYNLESKKIDYKEQLVGLHKTAEHNVEVSLEQQKRATEDYEADLKAWEEEKLKHDKAVRDAKNDYESKLYQWKMEKEGYDEALKEHNEAQADYETAVLFYNKRVEEYKKSYEDYLKQLSKFENDKEMNKAVDERNLKSEEDYNKLVEKHVQKVTAKNPDLKDYELNKLDYANGNLQWQVDLMYQKNPTLSKWQQEMKSEDALDKYFVDHARKENDYNRYKSKCKNIKAPNPVEQKNYEEQLSFESKYNHDPEDARAFLYLLDSEEEKLKNVINNEKNIDYEFFKNSATLIMYNKVVREELRKDNPNPKEPRVQEFSRYLDKEYRKSSLKLLRQDKALDKLLRNEYNENLKMTKGEKPDFANRFMRDALLMGDFKFRGMYHNRYENPKKMATTDPVTLKSHKPEEAPKKGGPAK